MPTRRHLLAAAAALALIACGAARAEWPDHAVRWIVPFAPGGANDLIARAAADGVSKRIGQAVVIENKPGAGAMIGADYVAKAKPDGYTFLIGAAGVITNSLVRKDMPYADSDLDPGGHDRRGAVGDRGGPGRAGLQPQGVRRLGEAAGRQRRQLGDRGHREHAALRGRDAEGSRRHQRQHHPVQERQRERHRGDGGQRARHLRGQHRRDPADPGRQAQGARHDLRDAHHRRAVDPDHQGSRLSRSCRSAIGPASSRPRARRGPSWSA